MALKGRQGFFSIATLKGFLQCCSTWVFSAGLQCIPESSAEQNGQGTDSSTHFLSFVSAEISQNARSCIGTSSAVGLGSGSPAIAAIADIWGERGGCKGAAAGICKMLVPGEMRLLRGLMVAHKATSLSGQRA